ncbi:winged helix DNA-binding domain-containing protein [Streptomyces sp. SB3404]|uniref:Winged helix DNA-binding domain-containing protein n=1 Tax=Streptomyces boncukensis TaxID=2711219 RepID=A0A6G4WWG5_9ACTN|nr:winged helix DNA-binding domain-containing protein [Streptomyces boncukensis]
MPAPLSHRALGRALLARQLLAARADMTALQAVEHLVGLQAQAPKPPYFGLWTRLAGFDPEELSQLLLDRRVVRMGVMRGTVHLVSDRDAVQLRPLTQVVHERTLRASSHGKALGGTDPHEVAGAARALLKGEPLGVRELESALAERWPGIEPRALGMTARHLLPLVQVPPRGLWGRSGGPVYALAETWLGRPLAVEPCVESAVLRYLGAFGPASVLDAQTWSGLTRLSEVLERLRPQLRVFRDEQGTELFDLPDAPRPEEDLPLPARFVAEYDNLVLAHADRSRLMDESARAALARKNGQVPGTVLLDGRVRGTWKADTSRKAAALTVTPLGPLSDDERAALAQEGARLLAFAAGGPGAHTVGFDDPAHRG